MRVETFGDATLYMGDCRDILPDIGHVDAVVIDPPYGIGFEYESHDDDPDKWFDLISDVMPMLLQAGVVVMPSCQIAKLGWWYATWPPDWMISWYKGSPGHRSHVGFNDWEPHLVWGKPPKQIHDYFQTPLNTDKNGHPCPKPVAYSKWLVTRMAGHGGVVCDPFMGSGTTGVAAIESGRKFIGIEIEPKYFDIACRRIDAAAGQGNLFDAHQIQAAESGEVRVRRAGRGANSA